MSGWRFLKNLISRSPILLSQGIAKSKGTYKEATVACILRIVPSQYSLERPFFESPQNALESINDTNVEILFIKRAERERDTWSGHVAFPGAIITY